MSEIEMVRGYKNPSGWGESADYGDYALAGYGLDEPLPRLEGCPCHMGADVTDGAGIPKWVWLLGAVAVGLWVTNKRR